MTIKPSPHIIEPPQKNRAKPKKKERKVRTFDHQEMYAKPSLIIQIRQNFERMTDEQVFAAVAPRLATIPDWETGLKQAVEEIRQREEEKEQKRLEGNAEQEKRRKTQPYKVVEDYYDATRGGYTEQIREYNDYTLKQLVELLNQVSRYDPTRRLHQQIKHEVVSWLRNILIQKQAEAQANTTTEPKPSRFSRLLRRQK